MTKSKTEPALQVSGAIQNAMMILANRVASRGGNLTEALVLLGKGTAQYESSFDLIADELATISRVPKAPKKKPGITAPEGGHVRIVRIPDQLDGWDAAISAGFPDTPLHYDVRRVGNKYPYQPLIGSKEREIILVNFGKDISDTNEVLVWGKRNGLTPANPRSVWAIGIHKPELPMELKQRSLVIASLDEGALSIRGYVPCGLWSRGKREARLISFSVEWDSYAWFAFDVPPKN